MQKLYIVTGANGHLGNTIVRTLVKQNLSVRAFILANDKDKMLKTLGVDVFKGDVRNKDSIKPLFDLSHTNFMPEDVIVIHTAGIVAITSKISPLMEQVNVGGTMNLVDLALENQVHRFIYISSVHAIPELNHGKIISEVNTFDPDLVMGGYAKTKAIATQYVLDAIKKGLNGIIIHPSGIIGPNDYGLSHTTQMIEDYMNGKLTSRINGGYDFVDVRDVASGVIQSTISGEVGVCYILSGHYVTIKELFDQLKFFSGKKRAIHVLPMWFAKMTAPLAEFYYKL
ncbi:MAG: SDR family NAD(P)-dependent oxidoreductase, partial [Acholeplasmataceae bacterium]|nr:SDR family NAD(P)-dependent oxidoreductase [Acholeplasmataceae bacterium]